MIAAYKKRSNALGLVCLGAILLMMALVTAPKDNKVTELIGALLSLTAGVSFLIACWFYIKAKGRSSWWMLVLVLNLLGLVVLALLKGLTKAQQ